MTGTFRVLPEIAKIQTGKFKEYCLIYFLHTLLKSEDAINSYPLYVYIYKHTKHNSLHIHAE